MRAPRASSRWWGTRTDESRAYMRHIRSYSACRSGGEQLCNFTTSILSLFISSINTLYFESFIGFRTPCRWRRYRPHPVRCLCAWVPGARRGQSIWRPKLAFFAHHRTSIRRVLNAAAHPPCECRRKIKFVKNLEIINRRTMLAGSMYELIPNSFSDSKLNCDMTLKRCCFPVVLASATARHGQCSWIIINWSCHVVNCGFD